MAFKDLQRAHLASLAILVLVFASGVLLGLAIDRGLNAAPAVVAERDTSAAASRDTAAAPHYLFEQVGLSSDQRQVVDSIVATYRQSVRQLRDEYNKEYDPRFRAVVERTRASIKQVMTPEQASKYDSLLTANDRQRRESPPSGTSGSS